MNKQKLVTDMIFDSDLVMAVDDDVKRYCWDLAGRILDELGIGASLIPFEEAYEKPEFPYGEFPNYYELKHEAEPPEPDDMLEGDFDEPYPPEGAPR